MEEQKPQFDLEDRTLKFAKDAVNFCKSIPKDVITVPLISQLVRSGTSIGANYREANGASSRNDFACKISICKKEVKEASYWINMILEVLPNLRDEAKDISRESEELVRIFSKIYASSRKKKEQ